MAALKERESHFAAEEENKKTKIIWSWENQEEQTSYLKYPLDNSELKDDSPILLKRVNEEEEIVPESI